MTHFTDGLRTGAAGAAAGAASGTAPNVSPGTQSAFPGAPVAPQYRMSFVPTTISTTNIAVAATLSGAPASATLSAGSGVTTTSINGVTYLDLGCERTVRYSGVAAATATLITVAGLDMYQVPLTSTFTGPASGTLTETLKCFRYVRSITVSGNTTSNISFGTGDTFGFPYRVDTVGDVRLTYSGNLITTSANITLADTTSPATALTGDVRGKWGPATSSSDGVKSLQMIVTIADPDTVNGLYGVPQV